MDFVEFDVAAKPFSDRLADILRAAGIRLVQRIEAEPGRRSVSVIDVHPDDLLRAGEVSAEATRCEREAFVRNLPFVRRPYSDKDMLLSLQPNDAGFSPSHAFHGEPFDPRQYRVVRGGWDHEHCYLCWAKVLPGEEWWATQPENFEDEIGLCLDCYSKLIG